MTNCLKKAFNLFKKRGRAWDAAKLLDFDEFGIFLSKILYERWKETQKRLEYLDLECGCFYCGFEIEDAGDFFILFGVVLHKRCVINYLDDGNKWENLLSEEGEKRLIARAMGIIWETNGKYLGNNMEIKCLKKANLSFI